LRLSDIPSDTMVFVDANVPLAAILSEKRAAEAEAFMRRVAAREIVVVTSNVVVSEVFHRALVAETCELLGVSYSAALRLLLQYPLHPVRRAADVNGRLVIESRLVDRRDVSLEVWHGIRSDERDDAAAKPRAGEPRTVAALHLAGRLG